MTSPDNGQNTPKIHVELWRSMLLVQLGECWNDVRQNDSILWQIPAGIGAIVGLIFAALGSSALKGRPNLLQIMAVLAVAAVTFSLIVAEYKNRVFQVSRNIYIKSIYKELLMTQGKPEGTLVPAVLTIDDYEMSELPGLSALATKDLDKIVQMRAAQVSGPNFLGNYLSRIPAFKTLFYVSILIWFGEIIFAIWLVVRFFVLP